MVSNPVTLDVGKIRTALSDADTPGLVLFTIALSEFGPRVMGDEERDIDQMDSAEMWADLHAKFGTQVTEEGENKLNALITGLRGGHFWRDQPTFMAVATALFDGDLGDLVNTGFEELNATELMWAILEMSLAWDSDDTPEFSLNTQRYIEEILEIEQDDQNHNSQQIEKSYLIMLKQMRELGVPVSMIRAWDEEYSDVMEDLADNTV